MGWNPSHRWDSWKRHHVLAVDNDVSRSLLQEARNPGSLPDGWLCNPAPSLDPSDERWRTLAPRFYQKGEELRDVQRYWATAIVGADGRPFTSMEPTPLHEAIDGFFAVSHPGTFAITEEHLEAGERLTLAAVYAQWNRRIGNRYSYPDPALHRTLSDLELLFRERADELILCEGDFNVHLHTDSGRLLVARLRSMGLELIGPFRSEGEPRLGRCPCPDLSCRCVNTYLYQSNPSYVPYQLDFFFATPAMRERLVACWPDPDPLWYTHSDHRPIFATFDI
jgi:hypothetical protein